MRRLLMDKFLSWEGQGVGKNACLTEQFQKVAHRVSMIFAERMTNNTIRITTG